MIRITTLFFFADISVEARTIDLWKLLVRYGKVGKVFIPMKVDKRGKTFGFVKFKEVVDVAHAVLGAHGPCLGQQ